MAQSNFSTPPGLTLACLANCSGVKNCSRMASSCTSPQPPRVLTLLSTRFKSPTPEASDCISPKPLCTCSRRSLTSLKDAPKRCSSVACSFSSTVCRINSSLPSLLLCSSCSCCASVLRISCRRCALDSLRRSRLRSMRCCLSSRVLRSSSNLASLPVCSKLRLCSKPLRSSCRRCALDSVRRSNCPFTNCPICPRFCVSSLRCWCCCCETSERRRWLSACNCSNMDCSKGCSCGLKSTTGCGRKASQSKQAIFSSMSAISSPAHPVNTSAMLPTYSLHKSDCYKGARLALRHCAAPHITAQIELGLVPKA